jgi:60 kDa SS-A/Ro ribonucleoprotein
MGRRLLVILHHQDDLAHQAVKYQQRDGWSHGDLLRLAHPKAPSLQHDAVFRWMLNGADSLGEREVKRKVRGEDRIAKYGAVGALPSRAACARRERFDGSIEHRWFVHHCS